MVEAPQSVDAGLAVAELISVIVTTYNREPALDAVLRSLARQTDPDFEVLIADDGSAPATAALIESWEQRLGRPLRHVWHDDRGFRAAEIRNRAIRAAAGPYCIFLDGDCIVRPDFVAMHRRLSEPGWFVTGNRALLSPALTEAVLREHLEPELWTMAAWLRQRLQGGLNRMPPLLTLPLGPLRKLRASAWRGARSCNLAVWRSDLDRVDGFDAAYTGWGREDSDLLIRLLNAGVRRKDGIFATGVLHLWHPEADRSKFDANDRMMHDAKGSRRVRAQQGLSTAAAVDAPLRDRAAGGTA
jgi:glycosyltransferase involved in cell wall biosynthesis